MRLVNICEKCGYSEIGEQNAKKVQEHEKIPISGRCNSIDGLIVLINDDSYSVFRKETKISHQHEILYTWERYNKRNLKPRESYLEKELKEAMKKHISTGFKAGYILGGVLHDPFTDGNPLTYNELSKAEFKRVSAKLKQMYPDLYANIEFKRELKYKSRSKK